MSDYDSDITEEIERNDIDNQKRPFLYDYYLSNSIDIFEDWKLVYQKLQSTPEDRIATEYLALEYPYVTKIEKFRTADIIRGKGFLFMLKKSFEETLRSYSQLFEAKRYKQKEVSLAEISQYSKILEKKLQRLLQYLQIVIDQNIQQYYNDEENHFEQEIFGIIYKLYIYVADLKLLWDISGSQILLMESVNNHPISLGGTHTYYKNIMRSLLKRNWPLKELYDRLLPELEAETLQNYESSQFITKTVLQVLSIPGDQVGQKQKSEFIDSMKGLYYLGINLRSKDLFYEYILTGFHLEVLSTHKMFKDYEELEKMYIILLERCKHDRRLMPLAYTLEMDKLPFEKRARAPQIELLIMDITYNYIAVAKALLEQHGVFPNVKPLAIEEGYPSTRQLLKDQNFNGLVGLLMVIQENSKEAFSKGDINVHKVYLEMSEVIKQIYLSYQHQNWLFPSDILLYIPLRYFMDISEDIKADVKKTLFMMVEAINEDRMPHKLVNSEDTVSRVKVERSQYLQVILYFMEGCHVEEQYINLPELLPTNLETSILYIKSLELKLNEKEPTPDQMPYVVNMLKTCEQYKLNIRFRWYERKESIEDREIEFNIEKGFPEDWMRKIYRQTINQRESEQIKSHFQKYLQKKGLTILNLANIFKYCHGLNPGGEIDKKTIKEQDLFTLLEEIKMLLSINFDIFNLNLDEEISLNYIHVCLSLYNTCYDETPFNEAYIMIMENIMKPYLRYPNASHTPFRNKYPGFFEKWIYSFQIANIFQELGAYISDRGEDDAYREDIINKIKLVRYLIDNKENIKLIMKIEDLTETIVLFSTLISRQSHPLVYIESAQLFCLFLNTFPEVRKEASLDFMLDASIFTDPRMASELIEYIKKDDKPYKKDEVSIINNMVKNLPQFMDLIGLKRTNEVLDIYANKLDNQFDEALSQLEEVLFATPLKESTFLGNIMRLVLGLKKQFEAEKKEEKVDILGKVKMVQESLQYLEETKQAQKQDLQFCQLLFLQDVVTKMDRRHEDSKREGNMLARNIFHDLVKKYGTNDDIIYFAEKLDFFDLILIAKKDQFDPREETILLDLLTETKYKGNETELIKKILRQSNKLSDVSEKAVELLEKQKDKIRSHHLNKFIHVNNRYPKERIEQFIIENIGCERNHAAVKIRQAYLIKDLVRKLEKIPKNICEELLLKPVKGEEHEKLIDFISNIFQKMLYLPIKLFENVNLKKVEEIQEENQDWNTESEGEQEEITKPEAEKGSKDRKQSEPKREEDREYQSDESDKEGVMQEEMPQVEQDQQQNSEEIVEDVDYDRPEILDMFYGEERLWEFELYRRLMIVRQEIDVAIDGKYEDLLPYNKWHKDKELVLKIIEVGHILKKMLQSTAFEIVARMPTELVRAMELEGIQFDIPPQITTKIEKMKAVNKKPPKWMLRLFSDREESDDSNIDENDSSEMSESDDMEDQEDQEEEELVQRGSPFFAMDSDDSDQQQIQIKKPKPKRPKLAKMKEEELEVPGLVPTYSKVQQEISGAELKREDLLKILEIALYWLLQLPESQIKTKQITSFYMDILHSNLGQIFFESFMTTIRYDETKYNLEWHLKTLKEQTNEKVEIGLHSLSMQDAINNILYLIRQYQQSNSEKESGSNILFKESSCLLPIAEHMMTRFDLPIQNNCITLLLLYIATNKTKIRNKINALDFSLAGNELDGNKKEYKLKYSEMVRIIDKICKHGSSNSIWETIQSTMNLKVKNISLIFSCIKGYGGYLYKKLVDTGQKIIKTIKASESELQVQHPDLHHEKLHNLENTYHIISKLVFCVKEEIKQFYFINKENLKVVMEEESEDLYEEMESVKRVPKKLLDNKAKIFNNKELIQLMEVIVYFIKMLKDQFYGKIEDKLFNKLIQVPKMIIEAVWYYIFIFKKHQRYKWRTPSQIEQFFKEHPFVGSYHYENLQEVFGLVIAFFNLEPFCSGKFKQFFLPILMTNHQLAREIPLMFKVPKINEDEDYDTQSILVTRKCSFDMAFYQVTGQAIQVQFHEEEGSDHGGLIRQLMIGWKGKGVGEEAFFIGKILGICFKLGVPYGGALDIAMFVAITNYQVTIDFFEQVDPEIYRSLKYIKQNDPEPLCLKFQIERMVNGRLVSFELIKDGRNIDLVQSNKGTYLTFYMAQYFYLGRERELAQLQRGFYTVVYPFYAEIFTPLEMMRQIKGEEIVDVKMLISKVKYEGYSAESAVVRWFWELIEAFDQEKMNMFIQFVTGSPKITVYNSTFSITIQKVYDIDCLPVAHTCFNTIDLPEYSTKEILEKKLMTAILQGNYSFGIL